MSKALKPAVYTGTRHGICFYQMWGKVFMRTKSSLTAERVKNEPAFEQTRIHAGLLAKASKIGSQVYRTLTDNQKKKYSFQFLTGKAMKMLKEGYQEDDIFELLRKRF